MIELGYAGPEPERRVNAFCACDEFGIRRGGEDEDGERGPVVLAARCEEERAVEEAEDGEEDREREEELRGGCAEQSARRVMMSVAA